MQRTSEKPSTRMRQNEGRAATELRKSFAPAMRQAIEEFLRYLRYERNASPETIGDYRCDIEQFAQFLTPPGEPTMPLDQVDHRIIREFVSSLYDRRLEKTSVARKLAAL